MLDDFIKELLTIIGVVSDAFSVICHSFEGVQVFWHFVYEYFDFLVSIDWNDTSSIYDFDLGLRWFLLGGRLTLVGWFLFKILWVSLVLYTAFNHPKSSEAMLPFYMFIFLKYSGRLQDVNRILA